MKRKISLLLVTTICAGTIYLGSNCTASSLKQYSVSVDGETVSETALVANGSTLIPARNVLVSLGYELNYEASLKELYITKKKNTLVLTSGSTTATFNGETITLSAAPELESGSFYIPAEVITEVLGYTAVIEGENVDIIDYDEEKDESWKENTGTIDLDKLTVTGDGVSVSDGVISITKGGDFTISGSFNGSIVVDTQDRVKLRLNGVDITSQDGPAIYIKNADKAYITLEKDTQNTLTDSTTYSDEDAKGVLFSNDDLEIKGSGSLTVKANYKHGIACDDVLTIENGNINITSVGDGIHANDGVYITGCTVDITAENDGVQSEGYIEIADGTLNITTTGEVQASRGEFFGGMGGFGNGEMPQNGFGGRGNFGNGEMPEMPEGGFGNGEMPQNGFGGRGNFGNGEMPEMPEGGFGNGEMPQNGFGGRGNFGNGGMTRDKTGGKGNTEQTAAAQQADTTASEPAESTDTEDESTSSKGIKADGDIIIHSGSITINSTDTCIKADGYISIDDGTLDLTSSVKKGIKAMDDLFINGGSITVDAADEGIESKRIITVNGGDIHVTAKDDGINAGGGSGGLMGNSSENPYHHIIINGGSIYVDANGDGIDSNGYITFNGGDTVVFGPTNSGNGALDSGADIYMNGGTLLAVGSVGMAETPSGGSAQNVLNMAFDSQQSAGTALAIYDSNGNELVSAVPGKVYQSVIYSSPDITTGEQYSVYSGGTEAAAATVESTVTAMGSATNGGGFGGRGNFSGGRMEQTN